MFPKVLSKKVGYLQNYKSSKLILLTIIIVIVSSHLASTVKARNYTYNSSSFFFDFLKVFCHKTNSVE